MGLGLSLLTVLLWGLVPLALGIVLPATDVYTVNAFRFLSSFGLLGIYLGRQGELPSWGQLRSVSPGLLLLAIGGLAGNYLFFVRGLVATSPSHAEVLIQLAHLFLGLGGLVVFKESYSRYQAIGLAILVAGMGGFFHEQLAAAGHYLEGSLLLVIAAATWAVYALAQKQLLQQLASGQIMWLIYGCCGVIFGAFAQPASLGNLSVLQWGMLIFCGLNTFVAYGAFAESLAHWPASRVSAILAVAPIVTIVAMHWTAGWLPLHPERLTMLSMVGAVAVVVGSIVISLGNRRA